MWVLYALGSAVAASLVAIFGKIGLQGIDPTQATIVRGVVMAIILVLGGLVFGKLSGFSFALLTGRTWVFILLSALAGAASWLLYFIALQAGPASAVTVIDKMSVVFVILLAGLFLGEALTLRSVLGILLTVAGSLLIIFK
jgi:transporter family protein